MRAREAGPINRIVTSFSAESNYIGTVEHLPFLANSGLQRSTPCRANRRAGKPLMSDTRAHGIVQCSAGLSLFQQHRNDKSSRSEPAQEKQPKLQAHKTFFSFARRVDPVFPVSRHLVLVFDPWERMWAILADVNHALHQNPASSAS